MVQPIRPQDVSSVYQQQAMSRASGAGQSGTDGVNEAQRNGRSAVRSDRVTLSDEALALRRVLQSLGDQPEVREQRIAALKQQIADGTYDRGLGAVAARLVEDGFLA